MEASQEGIRALWISLIGLDLTALLQLAVYLWSGSIALLGDTLHNLADALTAIPLGVAFLLGRRAATRRYTYGYGRAEDLAGITIVAVIAASSAAAGYEAIRRLLHPATVGHLWPVAIAALIGFAGNGLVQSHRCPSPLHRRGRRTPPPPCRNPPGRRDGARRPQHDTNATHPDPHAVLAGHR